MDLLGLLNFQLGLHSLILANYLFFKRKKVIVRRWWERRELKNRKRQGAYKKIFLYFKKHDHEGFYKFVGMNVLQFNNLKNLTKKRLQKKSYRQSLHHELKLSAVLNLLVYGGSIPKQSWFFLIGRSTMYKIIPQVCEAICEALHDVISFPNAEELLKNSQDFYDLYSFPNVVGIIDGKHVPIKAPPNSGAWFRNFKQNYSINLMAACDARGKFIWASVGDFGSKNDSGNFANSTLGMALEREEIDFPADETIPNTKVKCPFFFIADGGFALHKYVLIPYRKTKTKQMELKCKIFNVRLQHPRKTIERAFGILCKKYEILNSKLDFKLKTIDLLVFTAVHLYNYTFKGSDTVSEYISTTNNFRDFNESENDCLTTESENSDMSSNEDNSISRMSDSTISSKNSASNDEDEFSESSYSSDESYVDFENAQETRQFLTNYFMSPAGYVSWQFDKLL